MNIEIEGIQAIDKAAKKAAAAEKRKAAAAAKREAEKAKREAEKAALATHETESDNTIVAGDANAFSNLKDRLKRAIVTNKAGNAAMNELANGGLDIAIGYLTRFFDEEIICAIMEGDCLMLESEKPAKVKQKESKNGEKLKNSLDPNCPRNLAHMAIMQAYRSAKAELSAQNALFKAVSDYKAKRKLA